MSRLLFAIIGISAGLIIGVLLSRWGGRQNRQYKAAVDRYVNVEGALFRHIRKHILADKDLSWAEGMPAFVTIGIMADGTVFTDQEWAEVWSVGKRDNRDQEGSNV